MGLHKQMRYAVFLDDFSAKWAGLLILPTLGAAQGKVQLGDFERYDNDPAFLRVVGRLSLGHFDMYDLGSGRPQTV